MIVNPNLIIAHPDFLPKLSKEEIEQQRAENKRRRELRRSQQQSQQPQQPQQPSSTLQLRQAFGTTTDSSNINKHNIDPDDIKDESVSNSVIIGRMNSANDENENNVESKDASQTLDEFNTSNVNLDSFSPDRELRIKIEKSVRRCKFLHGCLVTDQAEAELRNTLSKKELLKLYGLYKQAFYGDVNIPQPSYLKVEAYFKYQAWHSEKGKSQDEALNDWFELYNSIYTKHSNLFLKHFDEENCNLDKFDPFPYVTKLYQHIDYMNNQITSKNNEIALLKQQRQLTNVALGNNNDDDNTSDNDNENENEEKNGNVQGYDKNQNKNKNKNKNRKQQQIFELVESIRQRMETQEQCYEKSEKQWLYQLKTLEEANGQLREKLDEMKRHQGNRNNNTDTNDSMKNKNARTKYVLLNQTVPLLRTARKHPKRGLIIGAIILALVTLYWFWR